MDGKVRSPKLPEAGSRLALVERDEPGGPSGTADPVSPGRGDAEDPTGAAGLTGPALATGSVLVVMPAYNAARTLRDTWRAIPADVVTEVLLVDDHSIDATLEVASQLAIRTLALPHNVGYGGNQKACYLEALRIRANIVVMLHPDGQYDPKMIPRMIQPLLDGEADMVLGSRMLNPGAHAAARCPCTAFMRTMP